jgi:hypothetical protein
MQRDRTALIVSTIALGVAMLAWFDLFAFSKVVYLPDWASLLPTPPFTGVVLAIPFLIPVVHFSHSLRAASKGTLCAAALAPLPSLVVYGLAPLHQHSGLALNLLIQYIVLAVLGCLLPGSVMLGFRMVLKNMVDRR